MTRLVGVSAGIIDAKRSIFMTKSEAHISVELKYYVRLHFDDGTAYETEFTEYFSRTVDIENFDKIADIVRELESRAREAMQMKVTKFKALESLKDLDVDVTVSEWHWKKVS